MSNGRKIYLINPKFQIKFSFFICSLLFLVSIIYPFTIYELMDSIIHHLETISPNIAGDYKTRRSQLFLFLFLLQVGFTGLTFFICIFFSHKIAGPLYKLQKHLALIRDGQSRGPLFFRQGDYFQEIADDVNLTFDQLEERYKNDLVYLSEVTTYMNNLLHVVPDDKRAVIVEIISKLNEIQSRFNSRD